LYFHDFIIKLHGKFLLTLMIDYAMLG
jgi:hypothetical protein